MNQSIRATLLAEVQNITISIDGQDLISIDQWQLGEGQIYGIVGETGSGKSTIGKWLASVDPVYWEINTRTENDIKSRVDLKWYGGNCQSSTEALYLLQDAYQIFNPYVPIFKHFRDVWNHHAVHTGIQHFDEIFTILKKIGVEDARTIIKRKVHQVSQGEAQRFAFVLGLIRPAPLRIYDEVFSNVDSKASNQMLSWLKSYCDETGTSVIVISHEVQMVSRFADRVFKIKNGKLNEVKTTPLQFGLVKSPAHFLPFISFHNIDIPTYSHNGSNAPLLASLAEFSIGRGESVGIYGESGIGKTTFLKGLLGEHPLKWEDSPVSGDSTYYRRKLSQLDIRYLPQSILSAFNPVNRLRSSIGEIQSIHGVDNQELIKWLNLFNLDKVLLNKYPDELSGGQIQRMGIISVLLGQPDLILLDESFSSVDQPTRNIIWDVLLDEQQHLGFSLLVVSHDVDWLKEKMNRVYELMAG